MEVLEWLRRGLAGSVLGAVGLLGGCAPTLPAPSRELGKPKADDAMPASFKCEASKGQTRPLIVEWSAPDRAALEALAKRNQLVVHFEGCALEPLRQCRAPAQPTAESRAPYFDRRYRPEGSAP